MELDVQHHHSVNVMHFQVQKNIVHPYPLLIIQNVNYYLELQIAVQRFVVMLIKHFLQMNNVHNIKQNA